MGAKSGFALKFLQWLLRGVQFCCSAVVLAIFSYYLAIAAQNDITIPKWMKAVEGISGVGVVYSAVGLLLLCCLAGIAFLSFFAIVIDVAFIGAFIYVAYANRDGMGNCQGAVDTPFGSNIGNNIGDGDFGDLPNPQDTCRMQTACFAVSIIAIFFFLFSACMEVVLVRHRRKEKRFGPSPANNYTSGYAKKGFFSRFRKNKSAESGDPNALPEHTHPDAVRPSYNTDATAVGNENGYNKYGESGFRHDGDTAHPETGVTNGGYRV